MDTVYYFYLILSFILFHIWIYLHGGYSYLTNIITSLGLKQLKNYKYQSSGYSWLDNKMNVYWTKCIDYMPLYIAPNLITLIGLCCQIFCFYLAALYSPTLEDSAPSYIYVLKGIFN